MNAGSSEAGRAFSADDARTLLGWVKEMNGNYVRLAHYPHNRNMTRMADRMGLRDLPRFGDSTEQLRNV